LVAMAVALANCGARRWGKGSRRCLVSRGNTFWGLVRGDAHRKTLSAMVQ
jgi:hypothetical protein